MVSCPYCHGVTGQIKSGKNQSGSQIYLCKKCKKKYTPFPSRKIPWAVRAKTLELHRRGFGIRAIARVLKVSPQSVSNWIIAEERGIAPAIIIIDEEKQQSVE